ncbi:MAG: DUF1059 domain-containing protein [Nitrososphaerota archaeon]
MVRWESCEILHWSNYPPYHLKISPLARTHLCIGFGLLVMKTLSCREAGFDCDYVVKGETEEEIFKNGAQHAMKDHGMKEEDITPEFKEKLRGLIKTG